MPYDDDHDSFDDGGSYGDRAEAFPHSGVGIASFIVAILALLLVVVGFVMVALMASVPRQRNGVLLLENGVPPLEAAFVGLLIIGATLVALIGTGLGIGGVCQSQRKKVFGVIGLCINGLILLGGLGIFLRGLVMYSGLR